jgi:hypothetical protein
MELTLARKADEALKLHIERAPHILMTFLDTAETPPETPPNSRRA